MVVPIGTTMLMPKTDGMANLMDRRANTTSWLK